MFFMSSGLLCMLMELCVRDSSEPGISNLILTSQLRERDRERETEREREKREREDGHQTHTHTHTRTHTHTHAHTHARAHAHTHAHTHTTHTHTHSLTHTHMHTHTRTHTHVRFCEKWGHPIGVMVFYCTNCMCYCPTPTLYLNLALTGDCAFQLSPKKPHSVWFISVLKSGDMGQCPEKSPSPCNTCVIPVSLYKSMSWFVTKTRTHTPHTHTHTHTCTHTRTHTHTHSHSHSHTHTHTHRAAALSLLHTGSVWAWVWGSVSLFLRAAGGLWVFTYKEQTSPHIHRPPVWTGKALVKNTTPQHNV